GGLRATVGELDELEPYPLPVGLDQPLRFLELRLERIHRRCRDLELRGHRRQLIVQLITRRRNHLKLLRELPYRLAELGVRLALDRKHVAELGKLPIQPRKLLVTTRQSLAEEVLRQDEHHQEEDHHHQQA